MFTFFIAFFWGLVSPNHTQTKCTHPNSQVSTMDDTGGETGHIPPHPPTNPTGGN